MRVVVRFVRKVLASRAGQLLFVIHLCWAVFVFAEKPAADPADYDCAPGLETGTGLLAGRPYRFADESALLKTLLYLDLPSVIPSVVVNNRAEPLFCDYAGSWAAALILLFFSSAQWWLIGYWIERAASALRRPLP